jgi:hypothetical protein
MNQKLQQAYDTLEKARVELEKLLEVKEEEIKYDFNKFIEISLGGSIYIK